VGLGQADHHRRARDLHVDRRLRLARPGQGRHDRRLHRALRGDLRGAVPDLERPQGEATVTTLAKAPRRTATPRHAPAPGPRNRPRLWRGIRFALLLAFVVVFLVPVYVLLVTSF